MVKDLRHAVRMLLHAKGWTAVVLISLALGIGANTTLFSAVSGLLLRTVPVPDPDTLVRLRGSGPNDMDRNTSGYGDNGKNAAGQDLNETVSYAVYQALREANATLTDILACVPQDNFNVIVDGQADLASGLLASGNYFSVLGVPASAGRALTPDDDRPSAPGVVVLSHGYWVRRFGSNPAALGKVIRVNNVPVTIVGVTPPDFTGVQSLSSPARDVTLPRALDSAINPAGTPRLN